MKFIKIQEIIANCIHSPSLIKGATTEFLRLLVLACCLGGVSVANADQNTWAAPVDTYISSPELVGKATLKVMLWNLFDAELYASGGNFDPDKPFALALTYRRDFSGQSIVEETIRQIENQQQATGLSIASWRSQLESIIPDVQSGTTITGIRTRDGHTVFYSDNELSGRMTDKEFTRLFFNIWTGEESSRPEFRRKLLGYPQS